MPVYKASALLVLLSCATCTVRGELEAFGVPAPDPDGSFEVDLPSIFEEEDCLDASCVEGGSGALHLIQGTALYVKRARQQAAMEQASVSKPIVASPAPVMEAAAGLAAAAASAAATTRANDPDLVTALQLDEDCPPGSDCATAFMQSGAHPVQHQVHAALAVDAEGNILGTGAEPLFGAQTGITHMGVTARGQMLTDLPSQ